MKRIANIFSRKKEKNKHSPPIIVDHREKNSLVISELVKLDIKTELKQLPVADFLIKDTAIERKTISDFKASIIDKRITKQLLELKQYPNPLLILEGLESTDPYSGIIHENAFRGLVLSILTEYKIPIIFTLNEKDTARYISVLAKKQTKSDYSLRASKIYLSDKQKMQFILEGFPGIGPVTAKKLLEHFKSLSSIFNSSEEELRLVIGKKAEILYKLINQEYQSSKL